MQVPSKKSCTAVDWSSQAAFSSALPPLGIGGSEDGAVSGVDFARW